MKAEEATVILVLAVIVLGVVFYQASSSGIISMGPGDGLSKKTCESSSGIEKDNCWVGLANQVFDQQDNWKKALEYCLKISEVSIRDECLSNIALDNYDVCLAMSSKDSAIYFDCVLFVTGDVKSCEERLGGGYLDECIEDNAAEINDCEKIKSEMIRKECEGHFA